MIIRSERSTDRKAIHDLNTLVFPTPAEADLVEAVRADGDAVVSLVAEDAGSIIGHVMFSPVRLTGGPELKIAGLGPMAVNPELQKGGVGKALARAGLEECEKLGFGAAVVLGHIEYYPKFGFRPSSQFGIDWEHEHDPDTFMVLELKPDYLKGAKGLIKFHRAFDDV